MVRFQSAFIQKTLFVRVFAIAILYLKVILFTPRIYLQMPKVLPV